MAQQPQRGFTLIEVIVVVAILGVLAAIGIPSFTTMINSNRSKSAAESVASGLRLARAEAIGRNAPMRFQLVSTLDSSCALATNSVFWVVTQANQGNGGYVYGLPTGKCDVAAAVPPDGVVAAVCTSASCADLPFIAHKSSGNTFLNVEVAADAPAVTFGPLGQTLANMEGGSALTAVNFTIPTDPDAKAWRVRVTSGSGAIKFCDPGLSATAALGC